MLPVTSELGGSGEDDRGLAPNPAPDDGFFGRQDGGYGFGDGGSEASPLGQSGAS